MGSWASRAGRNIFSASFDGTRVRKRRLVNGAGDRLILFLPAGDSLAESEHEALGGSAIQGMGSGNRRGTACPAAGPKKDIHSGRDGIQALSEAVVGSASSPILPCEATGPGSARRPLYLCSCGPLPPGLRFAMRATSAATDCS